MPLYSYKHSCGMETKRLFHADRESLSIKCERCGLGVTAKQVRNKNEILTPNTDGVYGVVRLDGSGD